MNRTLFLCLSAGGALAPLVVDSVLKGVALLGLATVCALFMGRASAATRHLAWLVALTALLVLPVLSLCLPQWRVLPGWAAAVTVPTLPAPLPVALEKPARVETPAPPLPAFAEHRPATEFPALDPAAPPALPVAEPLRAPAPAPASTAAAPSTSHPWWNWLPVLWSAGFVFCGLRLLAAYVLLRRSEKGCARCENGPLAEALEAARQQLGVHQRVRLLIDERRTIPMVWGVFRPRLVLPAEAAQWPAGQLHSVLLHELAHLRRRDPAAQWVTQIACALHWFNPLVWLAAWRLHAERERACDDLVLASGVAASDYAGHLLHVATQLQSLHWTRACGLAMAQPSRLEGRLVAVLNQRLNRRRVTRVIALAALAVGSAIVIPIAMLRAGEPPAALVPPTAAPAAPVAPVTLSPEPKTKNAQSLLRFWKDVARVDGKIPGARIAHLNERADLFFKQTAEKDPLKESDRLKLLALRERMKEPRDWSIEDVVALLDELDAIHPAPVSWCEHDEMDEVEEKVQRGQALPENLKNVAWGPAAPNGLRAAWVLDPAEPAYAMGQAVQCRVLFHNSGQQPVKFATEIGRQSDQWTITDALGKKTEGGMGWHSGWPTIARFHLAPGEYCEVPVFSTGIGQREYAGNEMIGAILPVKPGDDVVVSWKLDMRFGAPEKPIRVLFRERILREGPPPAGRPDRERYVRRITRDLLGVEPTEDEVAVFSADTTPDVINRLVERLLRSPDNVPFFVEPLQTGETKIHVHPADPEAAKRPQIAIQPSSYTLTENSRLILTRPDPRYGPANQARIVFFTPENIFGDPANPPYAIHVPAGLRASAFVWMPNTKTLWLVQKGSLKKINLADPQAVREEAANPVDETIPAPLRETFQKALNALNPPLEPPTPPAAPLPPAAEPKTKEAQLLFKLWKNTAMFGMITGSQVARLGGQVDLFLKQTAGKGTLKEADRAKLAALRERLKESRRWTTTEVIALLDELDALHPSPVAACLQDEALAVAENRQSARLLPEKLKDAAWGPPARNGLRAAWIFEPAQPAYAFGQKLQCRVLIHNTGSSTVKFETERLRQDDSWTITDGRGKKTQGHMGWHTGWPIFTTFELAPGEYCEVPAFKVMIGQLLYDPNELIGAGLPVNPGDDFTISWKVAMKHDPAGGGLQREDLSTGETKIHVNPADPEAEKRPQIAIEPGGYPLAEKTRLSVRRYDGRNGSSNQAQIIFSFTPQSVLGDPVTPPYKIALPDGLRTSAFVWMPDAKTLWLVQKGSLKKINFADPQAVREEAADPADETIPAPLREAFQKALDALDTAVAPLNLPNPSPPTEPKNAQAKSILRQWLRSARADGTIPSARFARLVQMLDRQLEQEPNAPDAPKLRALRDRVKEVRNWTVEEAVALLDELAPVDTTVLQIWNHLWALDESESASNDVQTGRPLPEKWRTASWGPPAPNGLRAAQIFEPSRPAYRLGETAGARVLFHNAGSRPILFAIEALSRKDEWDVQDAQGRKIPSEPPYRQNGLGARYRLAPGEYCEVATYGLILGPSLSAQIGLEKTKLLAQPGDEVRVSRSILVKAGGRGMKTGRDLFLSRIAREG